MVSSGILPFREEFLLLSPGYAIKVFKMCNIKLLCQSISNFSVLKTLLLFQLRNLQRRKLIGK